MDDDDNGVAQEAVQFLVGEEGEPLRFKEMVEG